MALDVDPSLIRKITLSGFSGDAWGEMDGPLAEPPASVPRFRLVGPGPFRFMVSGRDGLDGARVEDDAHTNFHVAVVILRRINGYLEPVLLDGLDCTNGDLLQVELVEEDVEPGDTFVVALTAVTTGASSASHLWVVPVSGVELAPTFEVLS